MSSDTNGPLVSAFQDAASRNNMRGAASLFKSGNIYYLEEFEDAITAADGRWQAVIVGTGTITAGTPQFRGAQAARLLTSATINDNCGFTQSFPAFLSNWGMEAMLDLRGQAAAQQSWVLTFQLDFIPGNGFRKQSAILTITNTAGTIVVTITTFNGTTNVTTTIKSPWNPVVGSATLESWHWIKMTMEPKAAAAATGAGIYGLLYLDDLRFDLRGQPWQLADGGAITNDGAQIIATVNFKTTTAAAKICGVDDIIITNNEPV